MSWMCSLISNLIGCVIGILIYKILWEKDKGKERRVDQMTEILDKLLEQLNLLEKDLREMEKISNKKMKSEKKKRIIPG